MASEVDLAQRAENSHVVTRFRYDGVYKQKTRESMGQDGKMDGSSPKTVRYIWDVPSINF